MWTETLGTVAIDFWGSGYLEPLGLLAGFGETCL